MFLGGFSLEKNTRISFLCTFLLGRYFTVNSDSTEECGDLNPKPHNRRADVNTIGHWHSLLSSFACSKKNKLYLAYGWGS
jgi:hypothetical protein